MTAAAFDILKTARGLEAAGIEARQAEAIAAAEEDIPGAGTSVSFSPAVGPPLFLMPVLLVRIPIPAHPFSIAAVVIAANAAPLFAQDVEMRVADRDGIDLRHATARPANGRAEGLFVDGRLVCRWRRVIMGFIV